MERPLDNLSMKSCKARIDGGMNMGSSCDPDQPEGSISSQRDEADRTGDADRTEEFVALLTEHRGDLFRFVLSILPDYAEAEAVFQRTSIVMWRKFDEFQHGTNFVRWAARVAQFEVRDYRKRKGRERLRFWTNELVDAVADTWLQNDDVLQEQRQALGPCLEKLPEKDRELVELRYGGAKTTSKEIAENLGRPRVTVYKALARIRRALYECIERTLAPDRRT